MNSAWIVSIGSIVIIMFGAFIAHEWINAPDFEEIDVDKIIKDIEAKQDEGGDASSGSNDHVSELSGMRNAA